ncbi:MAG: hypothetical protein JW882_22150 [Deltaproteobacteria bacterium]|nr:hypothetical protein [Deltaproteobacteria bacterium]
MNNLTDTEEYRHYISGQIDVIKQIATSMAAFHPQRDIIRDLANNVLDNGIQKNATVSYLNGVKNILQALEVMLDTVKESEQRAFQNPPGDVHEKT